MTEWERQETKSNPVVPNAPPDYVPNRTAWIPVAVVLVLVAAALFGLGYWLAPNAPSQLNQVKGCADLNDDLPGYNVKITDPAGKVVLDVPCAAVTPTTPAGTVNK